MSALASQIESMKARRRRFDEAAANYIARSAKAAPAAVVAPGSWKPREMPPVRFIINPIDLYVVPPSTRAAYETKLRAARNSIVSQRIVNAIAVEFDLTPIDIYNRNRSQHVAMARHLSAGMMFEATAMSYPAIGRKLANRDHTTALNSLRKAAIILRDPVMRARFEDIKALLNLPSPGMRSLATLSLESKRQPT